MAAVNLKMITNCLVVVVVVFVFCCSSHFFFLISVGLAGKRAILLTPAAEEAVKAMREHDDILILNALKLVASIAAHPGDTTQQ